MANRRTINKHDDSYLRVLTPQTIDGTNLRYENGQPVYKETFLPLQAKRFLEAENENRPDQIKHKIEQVSNEKKEVLDKIPVITGTGKPDPDDAGTGKPDDTILEL